MRTFLETLRFRNEALFVFGLVCLLGALFCVLMIRLSDTEVMGVNAWYKPLKFCLSTTLFVWAMAWYAYYLGDAINLNLFNWTVILCLGFEIVYIAIQAGRGELSHFNQSSTFHALMFQLMAGAATVVSLYAAYLGWKFFSLDFPQLAPEYLWAIRLGILLFVVFSLQGFVMGANMAHTIGAPDGSKGIPLLNWSISHGDLRIAHFVGMHALQVLPVLAVYVLKDVKWTLLVGLAYGLLAVFTLVQALQGRALLAA